MGRFLVDLMCGRLAVYLRFCGHDTVYVGDFGLDTDETIVEVATLTKRTVLSRDRNVCARVPDGLLLESRSIDGQLVEVATAGISISMPARPQRCGKCNGSLRKRDDAAADPEYVPDDWSDPTYRCIRCGQIYWTGSHWDRVAATIKRVQDEVTD